MFENNNRLMNAVAKMNSIDNSKFPLFINRIATGIINDRASKPFTDDEETKLETSFEFDKNELKSIINGVVEIFQLSCYHLIKPTLLSQQLLNVLKMEGSKVEAFVNVWKNVGKPMVDGLKQKSSFLKQLDSISYSISVETSSSSISKGNTPTTQLQLGLILDGEREDLNIEFNHSELFEFYKKLETVQKQLDALK